MTTQLAARPPRLTASAAVAVADVVGREGHVDVGDVLHARVADARPESLRVVAVYERAAGLGHVVLDGPTARAHAGSVADGAVFVAGGEAATRSLARSAAARPGVSSLSRAQYLDTVHAANQDHA
jgi:putative ABC transport system permease protein